MSDLTSIIQSLNTSAAKASQYTELLKQVAAGDKDTVVDIDGELIPTLSRIADLTLQALNDLQYQNLGDYAGGIEITNFGQVVRESGEFYRLKADQTLPYTTTGTWIGDDENRFVSVGDGVLRSDLAAAGGIKIIGNGAIQIDSLKGPDGLGGPTSLIDATWPVAGMKVRTLGYRTPGDGGGNDYEIGTGFGADDGGSVIDLAGSGLQAKGLFVDGVVTPERFGSQDFGDSKNQIESAMSFSKKIMLKRDKKYFVGSTLTSSLCRSIVGVNSFIEFTSISDQVGIIFPDSNGLIIEGILFESTGTVDQYISGGPGTNIAIEKNTFDNSGATQPLSGINGAVHFDNVGDVKVCKNRFIGGWRDKGFDAGNVGGNNLFRCIDISNSGESLVKIKDNIFEDVWSCAYVSNTNSLYVSGNRVVGTADTAFFDRCTSGETSDKRFEGNDLEDIGKAAFKVMDSNNSSPTALARNAWIINNSVKGWGLYVASECILSARNLVSGSYVRSEIKSSDLFIKNNSLTQKNTSLTKNIFLISNVSGVHIDSNDISIDNDTGHTNNILQWCSDSEITNNKIVNIGSIRASFAGEGSLTVSGNRFSSGRALLFSNQTSGVFQYLNIKDNILENSSDLTTQNIFGFEIFTIPNDIAVSITGNLVKTTIAFQDSNSSTAKSLVGLPFDMSAIIDNNTVLYSDGVKVQKMITGEILYPAYFRGLPGASRNNGVNPIEYKASTSRTSDVFSINQT